MSNHIDKNDPKRWFIVQDNGTGEESIKVFGNAGDQGATEVVTGQPVLFAYLTETELETKVNDVSGITDYYKDSVESESGKFQMPSGIYSD